MSASKFPHDSLPPCIELAGGHKGVQSGSVDCTTCMLPRSPQEIQPTALDEVARQCTEMIPIYHCVVNDSIIDGTLRATEGKSIGVQCAVPLFSAPVLSSPVPLFSTERKTNALRETGLCDEKGKFNFDNFVFTISLL